MHIKGKNHRNRRIICSTEVPEKMEGIRKRRKELIERWLSEEFQGKRGKTFKREGVEEDDEDREFALRFIYNEVADDFGKNGVRGVSEEGNQRAGR